MAQRDSTIPLDARRLAKEQQQRAAESTDVAFAWVRPVFEFNTQMLRNFASLCEAAANTCDSNTDFFSNVVDQQKQFIADQQRTDDGGGQQRGAYGRG